MPDDQVVLDNKTTPAPAPAPQPAPQPAPTPATAPAPNAVKPDWPDDWREKIAPADKTLANFASPKALYDAYGSLRQKLSSGELKPNLPFPDKGTAEEQTAWRQKQGIPETPDKYDLKLDSGLVIGDEDKPIVDDFLKHAHGKNMAPNDVKAAVEWYFQDREKRQAESEKAFDTSKRTTEDALRAEWGGNFRRNMNVIEGMLDGYMPAGSPTKDLTLKAIQTNPDFSRFMASVALALNPTATVVPGGMGANMANGIEDRLAQIRKMMREDRKAYDDPAISGPGGEFERLLEAQKNLKK